MGYVEDFSRRVAREANDPRLFVRYAGEGNWFLMMRDKESTRLKIDENTSVIAYEDHDVYVKMFDGLDDRMVKWAREHSWVRHKELMAELDAADEEHEKEDESEIDDASYGARDFLETKYSGRVSVSG